MKRKMFLGCAGAIGISLAVNMFTAYAGETVTIDDPVLSNTVHDSLGLDRWEELTSEQLAQITALTIDPLEFQGYYVLNGSALRAGYSLDLAQIGCLENLETLEIDNAASNGIFHGEVYGLSGLKDCRKLKSLKMAYNVNSDDEKENRALEAGGANTLLEIAEECDNLETLELAPLPEEDVLERLHAANADLKIIEREAVQEAAQEPGKGKEAEQQYAYGTVLHVKTTEELAACENPEDITCLVVSGDCDLALLEQMPNLNTLVISGYRTGLQNVVVSAANFDVIRKLPHLNVIDLNLCQIDADTKIFDEIEGLQTLRYIDSGEPLLKELEIYGQLTDFAYHETEGKFGSGDDASPDFSSMKNLRNLTYIADSMDAVEALQQDLNGSAVQYMDIYVTENSRDDEVPLIAGFNGMKVVRYISLNGGIKGSITWEGAEGLDKLEVLKVWLRNDFPADLTIYPELRKLILGFAAWTEKNFEKDVDLTSASKLRHLSFLGTGGMRDSDRLKLDLTVFGGIKGLAALHENGVAIDLLSSPVYRDRMIEQLR